MKQSFRFENPDRNNPTRRLDFDFNVPSARSSMDFGFPSNYARNSRERGFLPPSITSANNWCNHYPPSTSRPREERQYVVNQAHGVRQARGRRGVDLDEDLDEFEMEGVLNGGSLDVLSLPSELDPGDDFLWNGLGNESNEMDVDFEEFQMPDVSVSPLPSQSNEKNSTTRDFSTFPAGDIF